MEITKKDIVEAGSSKIAKIIEMKITEKEEWKKIETPEILAEICFHLDLKSFLAFSLVDKNTYRFIVSHYNDNQNFWRTYYNCNFPKFVYGDSFSRLLLAGGYYIDPSIRHSDFASYLLFFLCKDVDNAFSEYKMLPKDLQSEWIEKKSNFIQEYQTRLLKMKHPLITDLYLWTLLALLRLGIFIESIKIESCKNKFILVINDDNKESVKATSYNSVKKTTAEKNDNINILQEQIYDEELVKTTNYSSKKEAIADSVKEKNQKKKFTFRQENDSSDIIKKKRILDLEIRRLVNKLNLIDLSLFYIWCQIFESESDIEIIESRIKVLDKFIHKQLIPELKNVFNYF
ncbi:35921_t:CDS:2 [Gigaspora margarita]|uniref:35921_t:CDS:1 n=1 Tax=Gigaspora margarita TaxID=4874 RepID=A0ABN7UQ20_GIGMA|nr:35921_t:CDS:2 [Gigaspora margarita]